MLDGSPPRRADELLDVSDDPYALARGKWRQVVSGGRSEIGVYRGLTRSKIHIIRPYLAHESSPNRPETRKSVEFFVVDEEGLISDTPDVSILPVRPQYVEELTGQKFDEKKD